MVDPSRLLYRFWMITVSGPVLMGGPGMRLYFHPIKRRHLMAADKDLLKEVALELWNTTKKLRPELPKAPRAQLVLKALMTIGDMSDQLQAAMILGLIESQEPDEVPVKEEATEDDKPGSASETEERSASRVVRRRTGAR